MVASLALLAKRALVSLLLALAQQYKVSLSLKRESSDQDIGKAFRSVVKKVHPDKGGEVVHAQRLQNAREKWLEAKKKPQGGRPSKYDRQPASGKHGKSKASGTLPVLGKEPPGSRSTLSALLLSSSLTMALKSFIGKAFLLGCNFKCQFKVSSIGVPVWRGVDQASHMYISCCNLQQVQRVVVLMSSSSKVLDPMPAPLMSVEKAFLRSTSKKVWIVVCFTCGLTKLVQSLQKTTRP